MAIKLRPLSDQVMVITGASSGIGRATALAAARRGAKLVLASRDLARLDELQRLIERHGGSAIAVAADVGSAAAVDAVGERAVQHWGRIDTWVNNAGVTIFGKIEDTPEPDARRLFETNVWGVVHGSTVALKHMRISGGALVTVGSIASDFGVPFQGFYSASKHAVKGFTDSLRMEIDADRIPISVTLIKPASIGTPIVDNLAIRSAVEAKLPPPVYAPDEVARAILHAAEHPERDIYVGGAGRLMSLAAASSPHLADHVAALFGRQTDRGADHPLRSGNLDSVSGSGTETGSGASGRESLYLRATLSAALPRAAAIAAGNALVDVVASVLAPRRR